MAVSTSFTRVAGIIRRHKILSACLATVVGLLGACLLFAWLVLPYIVKTQAEAYVAGRGDRLTMDRVAIAPLFEPRLQIDNLRLTQPDGSVLLAFKQFSVELSLSSLVRGAVVIDTIKLDGPQAAIALLPKGGLNWDALLASPQGKPKPVDSGGASPPPRILIRKFSLADGQIDLADRRTAAVQSVQIKPLAITLTDLSTLPADRQGAYALTARSSLGAQVDWNGTVSLTPLSIAGSVRLDGLSLTRLAALLPLPPKLAPPQGTVTLATRYDAGMIGGQFDFKLAGLTLGIEGLRVAGKESPDAAFALTHAGLEGGTFDWRTRQIVIPSITLSGGGVAARRLADGRIDLLDLVPASPPPAQRAAAKPGPPKPAASVSTSPAAGPAAAWHYRVGRLALTGFAAEFRDQTVAPAADFALQDITAEVKDVSENLATPLPIHVALRLRDGGTVAVDGAIVPKTPSADLRVRVDGLALTPVQPYLGSATVLKLVGGTVSADGRASYDGGGGKYSGGVSVHDLRIMEGQGNRPFLAWKSLSTDTLTASPAAIAIRELRLDGLDTALAVAKDRSVNVTQILRPPTAKPVAHPAPATETHPSPPPVIDVGRLRIHHSQLDYADLSLALPFATHIHDLDGTIANISTRPNAGPVRLQLAGRVDEDGRASASGRFDPLKPTDLLDIDTAFDNIEMTGLTPYLATFAGRRIDSGKLTLHLQYKIDHGQLAGENRIILDQLTLGGRVRSPEARDLPLDFAIALLKDAHGRIDLGIPIAGSLADPKFSYGQVLWKAVSNILTRLVTSPFRALGALFGGGDSATSVTFPAGQSSLSPPAQRTLAQVAASLNSRPNLAVTIHGTWSEADRVAVKEQLLRRALADKLDLPAGADLSGIAPDKPDVQPVLEDLYADRNGRGGLMALKDGYRGVNAGKLDESVTDRALSVVTGLLGRKPSLSAAETAKMKGTDFHAMLYQRLRDAEDVPDKTLQALARARGDAAVAVLHNAHVPTDRVTVLSEKRVEAVGHDVPLEMGLSPVAPVNTVKAVQFGAE